MCVQVWGLHSCFYVACKCRGQRTSSDLSCFHLVSDRVPYWRPLYPVCWTPSQDSSAPCVLGSNSGSLCILCAGLQLARILCSRNALYTLGLQSRLLHMALHRLQTQILMFKPLPRDLPSSVLVLKSIFNPQMYKSH